MHTHYEVLVLWTMERCHPAGMIDGPGARAAMGCDGSAEQILQGSTSFLRRVNAGLGDGAGDTRKVIRGEE